MNTHPDETRLALWLEDELEGEELAAFEQWLDNHPEHFAARDEARRWRARMASAIPSAEEPPYPDFFNHRIQKEIRDMQPRAAVVTRPRFSVRAWLMPLAACAGMVLAFWLGAKQSGPPEIDVTGAPRAIPVEPIIYTPEKGVEAEWFSSAGAMANVIVLNGLESIPDSTDFSHTVYLNREREIDSTAGTATAYPEFK